MLNKKHIKAPKSYNPGRGRPLEHLAYLNKAEMEMLRQFNGNNQERGPGGLPSFPPADATSGSYNSGYGSAAKKTTTSTSSTGARGPTGPQGQKSVTGSSGSTVSGFGGNTTSVNKGTTSTGGKNTSNTGSVNAGTGARGPTGPTGDRSMTGSRGADVSGFGTNTTRNKPAQTAPNGSYYGPKAGPGGGLSQDARFADARRKGFYSQGVPRVPGDAEAMGRMMMAESATIRNDLGGINTEAMQGVGDVIRNRVMSQRYPDTVDDVMRQKKQFSPMQDGSYRRTPASPMASAVADSILSGETAPVVGNALNYANLDTVNNRPGYSSTATRRQFNNMPVERTFADAKRPGTYQHSFGTQGAPSDVNFGTYRPTAAAPSAPRPTASAAPKMQDRVPQEDPRYSPQAIPQPTGSIYDSLPRPSNPSYFGDAAKAPISRPAPRITPASDPIRTPPSNFAAGQRQTYQRPASGMSFNPTVPSGGFYAPPSMDRSYNSQDPRVAGVPGGVPGRATGQTIRDYEDDLTTMRPAGSNRYNDALKRATPSSRLPGNRSPSGMSTNIIDRTVDPGVVGVPGGVPGRGLATYERLPSDVVQGWDPVSGRFDRRGVPVDPDARDQNMRVPPRGMIQASIPPRGGPIAEPPNLPAQGQPYAAFTAPRRAPNKMQDRIAPSSAVADRVPGAPFRADANPGLPPGYQVRQAAPATPLRDPAWDRPGFQTASTAPGPRPNPAETRTAPVRPNAPAQARPPMPPDPMDNPPPDVPARDMAFGDIYARSDLPTAPRRAAPMAGESKGSKDTPRSRSMMADALSGRKAGKPGKAPKAGKPPKKSKTQPQGYQGGGDWSVKSTGGNLGYKELTPEERAALLRVLTGEA